MKNTKNWYRVIYIVMCLAGAAAYIAMFSLKPATVELSFSLVCFILAPLVFFVGTIVYNILKIFAKKSVANWWLLGSSTLVTILFAIGGQAVYGELFAEVKGATPSAESTWYAQITVTLAYIGSMIVFALMPLAKGINKTIVYTEKQNEEFQTTYKAKQIAEENARIEAEAKARLDAEAAEKEARKQKRAAAAAKKAQAAE